MFCVFLAHLARPAILAFPPIARCPSSAFFPLTIINILIDNEAKDKVNTKSAAPKGQKMRR
jgi:hypothetical protein